VKYEDGDAQYSFLGVANSARSQMAEELARSIPMP
jgi:protein-tyrosine-phosphatase